MLTISLKQQKEQQFSVSLGGQQCVIKLEQRESGLYLSLTADNKVIVQNVICLNSVYLIRYQYLGFIGDLFFYDTQGTDNPNYSELSTRFLLYYAGDE